MSDHMEEEPDKYIPSEYQGKLEPNYYCRAWNAKREKYCKNRAGKGTEHPGVGRCGFGGHDGRNVTTGTRTKYKEVLQRNNMTPVERYRDLPDTLQDIYDEQGSDPEPLSVEADIRLARSVLLDYVRRYEEARRSLGLWREWYRQEMDTQPPKVDLLPVEHVVTFLKKVTDIAQKEKKLRMQDAISLKNFYSMMAKMGKSVEHWVMNPDMNPEEKLKRIKKDWMEIQQDS